MKLVFLTMFFVAGLADCGGGGSTAFVATPAPSACSDLVPAPPPMLYPQDGATVGDGGFPLVLGFGASYPVTVALVGPGSTQVSLEATNVPSPLPTPAASPMPLNTPAAYSVPVLLAHSTYTVTVSIKARDCATGFALGSFTTK
jgi:hypothetical protein